MAKFKIVALSKDDNFMMENITSSFHEVRYLKIGNNKEYITKIYNQQLEEVKNKEKDVDFLILMHADVKVDIEHLLNHIVECSSKYDVMGLCGCAKISTSQHPLNWFCGSRPYPEHRWGCVTHGELNNQTSYFSAHSPNIMDHQVACIDGLCIIFGRKAIDSDLRFEERLKFDCYDTDISFSAVMTYKMRLGVLVEKSLQHYSVGRSILTENFQIYENILREKFNIPLH